MPGKGQKGQFFESDPIFQSFPHPSSSWLSCQPAIRTGASECQVDVLPDLHMDEKAGLPCMTENQVCVWLGSVGLM